MSADNLPPPDPGDDPLYGAAGKAPELDEPAYQPEAVRQVAPAKPPPMQVFAIPPERPKGSVVIKVFLVALLGVGAFGGYWGYCSYKAGQREHAMWQEAHDLHQCLMRLERNITGDDIQDAVVAMAGRARVGVSREEVQPSIEPMSEEAMKKLPPTAQMGLGLAAKVPGASGPAWIVGFKGRFMAKHGAVKRVFEVERYTHFQWVVPPEGMSPPDESASPPHPADKIQIEP